MAIQIEPIPEKLSAGGFAVILAGGDGVRLRQMTKRIAGCELPKQFCQMLGDECLLTTTRKRIARHFPPENVFFSLTESHEEFYRPLLDAVPAENKIVQTANRGTAAAMLFSLFRLAKIDPEAVAGFFPADHYVSDDVVFMNHVADAYRAVANKPEAVVLVGIEPLTPKSSYGWIEPCPLETAQFYPGVRKIGRFWEKPTTREAAQLMKRGGLWNSFVIVGRVKNLIALFRKHLPDLYRLFAVGRLAVGTFAEHFTMGSIYRMIETHDLSFDVLERCREELYVLHAGGLSWSSLADPEEVLLKMAQLGLKNRLFPLAS
ncbi:MAG: hypothetical protein JSS81_20960 [Acidobacteria bacterium]|nr:hypothetical protein [Acidobacteriota bacterium]